MKINDFARKNWVWKRLTGPDWTRPGGTRGAVLCLRQGSSGRDYSGFVPPTQLSPQGAGRIQSLRAFRRAKNHQKQAWGSNLDQKSDFWLFWNFWEFIKKVNFAQFGESLGRLGVSPPTQPNPILFFWTGERSIFHKKIWSGSQEMSIF